MAGLADIDGGPVAINLHLHFGIDLTPRLLRRKSWAWLRGRAYSLLDQGTLTRKAATSDGL